MALSPRLVGLLACAVNFGLLAFNVAFHKAADIAAPNAAVFSPFGQLMILVWGLTFALTGLTEGSGRSPVWWAFALEKAAYVYSWVTWMSANDGVGMLKAAQATGQLQDLLVPVFHLIYGPVDFLFLVVFVYMGLQAMAPDAGAYRAKRKK